MNPSNILIVEDNEDFTEGIRWALEQEGFKVTAVSVPPPPQNMCEI